ncbi:hypothetical protein SS05631_c02700 [Sinorhizobium sp. CCBAU 05631]|nr:hypothetical protein SS05631_c02700 [Sinorhizobium sp. CCBAU 05631]
MLAAHSCSGTLQNSLGVSGPSFMKLGHSRRSGCSTADLSTEQTGMLGRLANRSSGRQLFALFARRSEMPKEAGTSPLVEKPPS